MRLKTATRAPLAAAAAIALFGALAGAAQAQVFFRPFGHVFYEKTVEEAPPYGSRGAVARILSREGFRLIGPLSESDDDIVATGVDARGRRTRFVIDPYVGDIVRSWRLGGGARPAGPRGEPEPEFVDRDDGGPRVIDGIDGPHPAHPHRSTRLEDDRQSAPRTPPSGRQRDLPPSPRTGGARAAPPHIGPAPAPTQATAPAPAAPAPEKAQLEKPQQEKPLATITPATPGPNETVAPAAAPASPPATATATQPSESQHTAPQGSSHRAIAPPAPAPAATPPGEQKAGG